MVDMEMMCNLAAQYGAKIVHKEEVSEEEWNRLLERNKELADAMYGDLRNHRCQNECNNSSK